MTTTFRPLLLVVMAALTLLGCGRERVQITVPDDSQLQTQLAQETKSSGQDSSGKTSELNEAIPTVQKTVNSTKPQPATGQIPVSTPVKKTGGGENNPQQMQPATAIPKTNSVTTSTQQATKSVSTAEKPTNPAEKPTSPAAQSASPRTTPEGLPLLSFGQFFDGDDRTTPASRFWDLKGQTVEIHGFMGEVLSLEKHWFLLIPAPGAECPFDNGDGTLWNEIMIVFVKEGETLRYTRGPLKIKGTLDVGVKVDQSGYRTMFRMQDATFETME